MEQILLVCGTMLALISWADAGQWYKSDDGHHYYIETEKRFNWFDVSVECYNQNASTLFIETAGGVEKHKQVSDLAAKLAGRNSMDFWIEGMPSDNLNNCPSLWSRHYPPCTERLGYICEGDPPPPPPPQPATLTLSSGMEPNVLRPTLEELNLQLKATNEKQRNELEEKSNELNELRKTFETQTKDIEALRTSFIKQSIQLKDNTKAYENQAIELEAKNGELNELKVFKESQETRLHTLATELETLKKANEKQATELKEKADEWLILSNSWQNQTILLEQKTQELNVLKKSCEIQSMEMKTKTEDLEALNKSSVSTTEELERLKKTYTLQTSEVKNITFELQALRNSCDQHKTLLVEKIVELDEQKKSCKIQIDQGLKEKEKYLKALTNTNEARILELTKECDMKLEDLRTDLERQLKEAEILADIKKSSGVATANGTNSIKYYNFMFRNGNSS